MKTCPYIVDIRPTNHRSLWNLADLLNGALIESLYQIKWLWLIKMYAHTQSYICIFILMVYLNLLTVKFNILWVINENSILGCNTRVSAPCMSGSLISDGWKNVRVIPTHAQLAILRVWQEATDMIYIKFRSNTKGYTKRPSKRFRSDLCVPLGKMTYISLNDIGRKAKVETATVSLLNLLVSWCYAFGRRSDDWKRNILVVADNSATYLGTYPNGSRNSLNSHDTIKHPSDFHIDGKSNSVLPYIPARSAFTSCCYFMTPPLLYHCSGISFMIS